jgi:hypothetical protein
VAVSPSTVGAGSAVGQWKPSVFRPSLSDAIMVPGPPMDSVVVTAFGVRVPSFCLTSVVSIGTQAPFWRTRRGLEDTVRVNVPSGLADVIDDTSVSASIGTVRPVFFGLSVRGYGHCDDSSGEHHGYRRTYVQATPV